jgi:hypothetical protein
MLIIGIDPGITGSICFFEDGKIIDVVEMPNMAEGKKNKKQVNGAQIYHEILLRIKNLNKEIDSKVIKRLYNSFKRFANMLFARRFNLFVDFLKLTSLFIKGKIAADSFLYLLSQIFRLLTKKKHSRFMYFLKYLFTYITKTELQSNRNLIQGIKIIINGKILGKPRSSSSCLLVGSVPIQTINANIHFSKIHAYTLYGVFGFKLWVHYS